MHKRLAVVTTHPIQYYAPIFKLLAKKVELVVFYTWGESSINKFDPGFGKTIKWDIPLLDGYNYKFIENTSKKPGSAHFTGIINPSLIPELQSFNADAILVIGYAYYSHLKVLTHFKNKTPIWFRGDSHLLDKQNFIKKFFKWLLLRWVYKHVDIFLFVGTNNKKYYEKYGFKESAMRFAPHAIDNERFAANRKDETLVLRKSLGIKPDDILILFAGKFETKKNPFLLLNAVMKILEDKKNSNLHLLFVGNGVLEVELKAKSKKYKKNIHFLDFENQTKMPVVYQACEIFCLPSCGPGETWGLAVNEAMAAGKPVITSDKVGCAVDLVKNEVNGYIFNSGDESHLISCLNTLLSNPDQLKEMGLNSQRIISEWSIEMQVENILNVYE